MELERFIEILSDISINREDRKFSGIENKRSERPDIHAFLLLDELVPGTRDMISAAEHDEFYLDVGVEELVKVITEEQVIELRRCGVHWSEYDCLVMFA